MIQTLTVLKHGLKQLALTIETILKILLLSRFPSFSKKIKPCQKDLLILANGPSLNNFLDTNKNLNKYDILTVNFSPFSEYFLSLKPNFHFITAPELWRPNVTNEYLELAEKLFLSLKTTVTWQLYLFMPFEARKFHKWQTFISKNQHIKVMYFNTTPVEGFNKANHFFFRKNLGMPRPHNVLIPSLMVTINMGYKRIYLAGVDHSWLDEITVTQDNETLVCQKHFYDENIATSQPMNMAGIRPRKLHEILHKFYLTFKAYFEIELYAKYKNVQIFNITKSSYIDAFRKVDL